MEEQSFVRWMRQNNQIFVGDEYKLRLGIYTANSRFVQEQNKAGNSWTVALNKFACLTPLEYRSRLGYNMIFDRKVEETPSDLPPANYPSSLDYRESGVVNPIVKDQGSCAAGWVFAAIQSVESSWALEKKGSLLSISESNIIDCHGEGCTGHGAEYALDFIRKKQDGFVQLEENYPYDPTPGECHFHPAQAPPFKVKMAGSCLIYSEITLKFNLARSGPCACPIYAGLTSFQLYNSGIYDDPKCPTGGTNHYVGVVGYGGESNAKYWILRNSWGADWGEEGYMRLHIYKDRCGILSYNTFAHVKAI